MFFRNASKDGGFQPYEKERKKYNDRIERMRRVEYPMLEGESFSKHASLSQLT